MVKVIVHIAKAAVAVLLALLCVSCGFEKVDGSGNVVTQNRNISDDFTAIAASNGLEVIIEQGNERAVIVEADDNLQEHIKIEVNGKELKISSDVNIGSAGAKKVIVKLPEVESIESSSGSSIISKNTLKSNSLHLACSSGGGMEVTVAAQNLKCESSSGSSITVTGKTEKLETKASSGSSVNAGELQAENVISDASSGGHIYVNPTQSLSAEASSGGNIYYITTPDKLEKKVSSSGSVSQQKQ